MRSDARKKLADPQPHWDAGVNEIIRRERAAALRKAARAFDVDGPYLNPTDRDAVWFWLNNLANAEEQRP